ncbi:MAG: triose-phosphate isomerase [Nitrospira sp.]|nr:MAG: triose-phosphate isomerase [Nitrospira sp.]
MGRRLIVGNWKMNKTASQGEALVRELARLVTRTDSVDVVLAPPFTALASVRRVLPTDGRFVLGAQDLYWEDQGAFTGEVSGPMLLDLDCRYVIVGHSERRQYFGDRDEGFNKKVGAALRHRLSPILCIGETLAQHESGLTNEIVITQLLGGLASLTAEEIRATTIAYEPVWAIGTGRAATALQAEAVHATIRHHISTTWDAEVANGVRILYGGSVTAANAGPFLASQHVDGALVGGACLDPQSFAKIIALASSETQGFS